MTTRTIAALLSLALRVRCCVDRCECPPGHDLRTGVRRDGNLECWPHPVGDPEWDGTWGRPERSRQSGDVVRMRLLCPRGRPVIVDYNIVACTQI